MSAVAEGLGWMLRWRRWSQTLYWLHFLWAGLVRRRAGAKTASQTIRSYHEPEIDHPNTHGWGRNRSECRRQPARHSICMAPPPPPNNVLRYSYRSMYLHVYNCTQLHTYKNNCTGVTASSISLSSSDPWRSTFWGKWSQQHCDFKQHWAPCCLTSAMLVADL